MLSGNFAENPQQDVVLNEPKYNVFLKLLKVTFPPHDDIEGLLFVLKKWLNNLANGLEELLHLANFYQIDLVLKFCDNFIAHAARETTDRLKLLNFLKLADKFNLKLAKVIFPTIKYW